MNEKSYSKKKYLLYFVCTTFLFFAGARLYYFLTDDFRLTNISYVFPFDPAWEVPPLISTENKHLLAVLNQKFTYIGKGSQSYAFASEDGHYVLKFFKFKHLKPSIFIDLLPPIFPFKNFKENCIARKKRKLIGVFDGYALAYKENKHNAALFYLHLLPTDELRQKVTVVDKLGIERSLELDPLVFLIQKKGETFRARLQKLFNQHAVHKAQHAIQAIIEMYISEYQRGLLDHDHGVMYNTGFIGEQAFHLDVGKLSKRENIRDVQVYKQDLEQILWKIHEWVKKSYPEYSSSISLFLNQKYQEYTGECCVMETIDPKKFKKTYHQVRMENI